LRHQDKACSPPCASATLSLSPPTRRSSILRNGKVRFEVPASRLDNIVSKAEEDQVEFPDSIDNVEKLIKTFAKKNFTVEELIILTGAHSIGQTHCSSLRCRLSEPSSQITLAGQP
jgi:peroxidase